MNGKEILDIVIAKHSDILPYFKGVSAINTVTFLPVNHVIICNTAKLGERGKHWIAIARSSKHELQCFDSLGCDFELLHKHIKLPGIKTIVGNKTVFQSHQSSTCPLFCIYFLVCKILNPGVPFDDLLEEIFPVGYISKCELVVTNFHNTGTFYLD